MLGQIEEDRKGKRRKEEERTAPPPFLQIITHMFPSADLLVSGGVAWGEPSSLGKGLKSTKSSMAVHSNPS